MALELKLYLNVFEKDLQQTPTSQSRYILPDFFQGDKVPMQVNLYEPDPDNDFNSFIKPPIDNMTLKMAIGPEPVGNVAESPFVTAFTWSKDVDNDTFSAEVDFNTAALDTWLAAGFEEQAYLEIEVTEGNAIWTVFQRLITIKAQVIEPASTSVAVGETPLSLEMANGLFVPYLMPAGRTLTFQSTDLTAQRILGVDNDATPIDQPYDL